MSRSRLVEVLRSISIMAGVTLLLFLLVEGTSSAILSAHTALFGEAENMQEERSHAEYDSLLGWVNRPNLSLPDLYGPGIGFHSNGQRFRGSRDYPPSPPPGVTRLVCSGDSFTMGHSVSDDQAWCSLLALDRPGVETVNMGMAAYGIDQAFLWYRRDGATLHHQVHILAFITSDFERMAYDNFLGYPKPYLRLVDGRLEVTNVPVPHRFNWVPRLQRFRSAVTSLGTVRLGLAVMHRLGVHTPAPEAPGRVMEDAQVQAVAAAMFEELRSLDVAKQSRLVLVYLPRTGDKHSRASDPWRAFVRREADRLGVTFIDLVEAYRQLPLDEGEQFFVRPYRPSHYNVRGNAWVAAQLGARLFPQREAPP